MTEVAFEKGVKPIEAVLPIQPIGWRVLIRPYEAPETSVGGILFAKDTKESENLLTYVGQVVAMGSECFKAISRSGIDMSQIDPKPEVGDWIMYGTYGGQTIKTKTGAKYIIMNDDGIMGICNDPAALRAYI